MACFLVNFANLSHAQILVHDSTRDRDCKRQRERGQLLVLLSRIVWQKWETEVSEDIYN